MDEEAIAQMQGEDPDSYLELEQGAIHLGLDLQGGIHIVLRVKTEEIDEAARSGAVDRAIQVIRNRVDGLGVAEPVIQKQGDDRIIVDLPGYTDPERAVELIGQTAVLEFKLLETIENANIIISRIDSVVHEYELAQKGGEAVEESDTETPSEAEEEVAEDTASGEEDILAELMGDSASDTTDFGFEEMAGVSVEERPVSSRMEPGRYDAKTNVAWPGYLVSKRDRLKIDQWLSLEDVRSQVPVDVQWAWSTRSEVVDQREVYRLFLMKRKTQFLGRFLENITSRYDQLGNPEVGFQLSGEGNQRFAQLTGANIGKPMGIVLDNQIESAPFIQAKIRGSGVITMGSGAKIEDAINLEIVLKAGSLPAPVEVIEKNIVGATLGADSISKGITSSLVGLALVLLFIAIYYRVSGVIADVGLVFNIFFLLSAMALLGSTLTMPGIAGIILTVGISVDSNILIFERIREELRTGKTVRASIDAGYSRAFVAILDAHVTTLITAGALFIFGSGPIRGFAVTLFFGVAISLYTAYVVTKAIFDIRKAYKTLSI
jgi:protein-export membrane protein SecD